MSIYNRLRQVDTPMEVLTKLQIKEEKMKFLQFFFYIYVYILLSGCIYEPGNMRTIYKELYQKNTIHKMLEFEYSYSGTSFYVERYNIGERIFIFQYSEFEYSANEYGSLIWFLTPEKMYRKLSTHEISKIYESHYTKSAYDLLYSLEANNAEYLSYFSKRNYKLSLCKENEKHSFDLQVYIIKAVSNIKSQSPYMILMKFDKKTGLLVSRYDYSNDDQLLFHSQIDHLVIYDNNKCQSDLRKLFLQRYIIFFNSILPDSLKNALNYSEFQREDKIESQEDLD